MVKAYLWRLDIADPRPGQLLVGHWQQPSPAGAATDLGIHTRDNPSHLRAARVSRLARSRRAFRRSYSSGMYDTDNKQHLRDMSRNASRCASMSQLSMVGWVLE